MHLNVYPSLSLSSSSYKLGTADTKTRDKCFFSNVTQSQFVNIYQIVYCLKTLQTFNLEENNRNDIHKEFCGTIIEFVLVEILCHQKQQNNREFLILRNNSYWKWIQKKFQIKSSCLSLQPIATPFNYHQSYYSCH